ncbi:M20/M25/M40 family metallo-hydrolase [Caulobacter sp. 17J80-11]|uniref:M20/M25/M40 family metallo-hydrolase n=1 Tax=Caulobacter sp. 17J80-11 TaxID=2763502 RepID=UPI001653AB16|nr:M20/M25/M40 family metallo-hydrolase [Caulobacter sp. 17J80-11]MBC6983693.1 M20/M25/M40 family metallo-hydrolase [Caulobacter sp. 17J80-11]
MRAAGAVLALVAAIGVGTPALASPFAKAAAASHGASAIEARMTATVDANTEASYVLLQRLVDVNSGTMNLEGVREVGRMMKAELEPLGFEVRWVNQDAVGRAGHLIAEHKGKKGAKRLLLIGHMDTVFEPSSPFQKFKREGDWAEGPGTSDMKGGLVVMVEALRAMKAAGALKDANIVIVLTGDEERSGTPLATARADLIAAGKASDVALEYEALVRSEGKDWGSIARRSSSDWTLKVSAKSGHSSGIFKPEVGDGAIYELARILSDFRKELPEPYLTYNVGVAGGGASAAFNADETAVTATGKDNIIPAAAIARGDLRTLTDEQTERARAKMREIVRRHLPGTEAEITFEEGYPAMAPTEANRAVLGELNGVNRDLGLPEMPELDPSKRGAGDISHVAPFVPGLAGVGAAGTGAHAPGERVDLTSLPLQAKRMAVLMYRLSQEKR